jgi:hypothetical protein
MGERVAEGKRKRRKVIEKEKEEKKREKVVEKEGRRESSLEGGEIGEREKVV